MKPTQPKEGGVMDLQEKSAEPPRSITRAESNAVQQRKISRLRTSTYLGMLLLLTEQGKLSEDQRRYVRKLQASVKFSELEKAISLVSKLRESPRSLARARVELERLQRDCPRIDAKSNLPEPRRIGVGYRDKGSLRLPHEDHDVPSRSWWSQDIEFLLLDPPEEPQWIASEQLIGMDQQNLEIQLQAIAAVCSNCSSTYHQMFKKLL